jgi:hypothetical protein
MSLFGDIEEVKIFWKKTTLIGKFVLIVSGFLASGSLANLSETIFKWKEGIKEAVTFTIAPFLNPLEFYCLL